MIDALADEFGVKAGVLARQTVGSKMDEETARLLFGAAAVIARDSEMMLLPEEGSQASVTLLTCSPCGCNATSARASVHGSTRRDVQSGFKVTL